MQEILEHAVQHCLIAHRFYGADGKIMVFDEWPDAESFLGFFSHVEPQLGSGSMMSAAGSAANHSPCSGRG
jgi:hypothetical protein